MTYLIGVYVIFRCVDAMCRSKESFAGDTARLIVTVSACLTITLAILLAFLGDTALVGTRR